MSAFLAATFPDEAKVSEVTHAKLAGAIADHLAELLRDFAAKEPKRVVEAFADSARSNAYEAVLIEWIKGMPPKGDSRRGELYDLHSSAVGLIKSLPKAATQ